MACVELTSRGRRRAEKSSEDWEKWEQYDGWEEMGGRWLADDARRESRAPEAKSHSVTVQLVVLCQSYLAAEDTGVDDSIYTSLRRLRP